MAFTVLEYSSNGMYLLYKLESTESSRNGKQPANRHPECNSTQDMIQY